MDNRRKEFLQLFLEAKKIEKEAFSCLLPESARGHIEVIQKEVKELVFDLFLSGVCDEEKKKDGGKEKKQEGKVKKVDIG